MSRLIPSSPLEAQLETSAKIRVTRAIGFGYDEATDDYKVIKLYGVYERRVPGPAKYHAELYSLKSNNWKTVDAIDHDYSSGRSMSINNTSYWLCMKEDETRMSIITFDFSVETFREIIPPHDSELEFTYVLTYNGSLAILVIWQPEEYQHLLFEEAIEDEAEEEEEEEVAVVTLWIMKKNGEKESWHEEFTKFIHRACYEPVEFTKTGKLIFWKTESDLALWDKESGQVNDLDEFGNQEKCFIVEEYVESLILL